MFVRRLRALTLLGALPLFLANCSDDPGPAANTGGTASTAGAAAGGSASGSGGASGGTATGGTATGGAAGNASGGGGTGGTATGGIGGGGAGGTSVGGGGASAGDGGAGGSGGGSGGKLTLKSTEIVEGQTIPEAHTCDGKGGVMDWGVAPSLKWENPPAGTMSYAFFMIDWTLTMKTPSDVNGYHSAAWNIPTTKTELAKGWALADLGTGVKGINGGYLGPCPPNGPDTYHLIIMALPMETYNITATGTAGVKSTYDMLKGVALGTAEITGTYKKK